MSKAAGKGMRNVKKVIEKVNHNTKMRRNIQAQMAVGEFSFLYCIFIHLSVFMFNDFYIFF